MKKLLYTSILLILISSCRSINKMVEKGEYDEAIVFATKKLAGKKNKKTKHVQGLEEAFLKITQRDLDRLAYLDAKNNPANWERVLVLSDKIARRQNRIIPFLPLVSKEGYFAQFEMVDTKKMRAEALDGAAAYEYNEGKRLLDKALDTKDKFAARAAYRHFENVSNFRSAYADSYKLKELAKEAGTIRVLIDTKIETRGFLPMGLAEELSYMNVISANSFWKEFHLEKDPAMNFDYLADLAITNIEVSPERETITHHTDKKKIKDGFRFLKNKKGEFLRDSTGKKIKEEKFKVVRAEVSEIFREKATYLSGVLKLQEASSGKLVESFPLSVEASFSDYASSFRGDRRAICAHDKSRLRSYPEPFPRDEAMILDAAARLKGSFVDALHRINI